MLMSNTRLIMQKFMVQVELKVEDIFCISRAALLPFEVIDASRTVAQLKDEDSQFATVTVDTRLDKRYIDLRTPLSQSIFKIQSGVCQVPSPFPFTTIVDLL